MKLRGLLAITSNNISHVQVQALILEASWNENWYGQGKLQLIQALLMNKTRRSSWWKLF